jgi:hypothetical protein
LRLRKEGELCWSKQQLRRANLVEKGNWRRSGTGPY